MHGCLTEDFRTIHCANIAVENARLALAVISGMPKIELIIQFCQIVLYETVVAV